MSALKRPVVDLKSKYKRSLSVSFIASLSILIIAFKFSPHSKEVASITTTEQELIHVENIINTIQKPGKPIPPKAPQIIDVTPDDIEDIELQDVENDENDIIGPPDLPPDNPLIEEDIIFIAVEHMPEILGGITVIQEKAHFTEIAKRSGIEGKAIIEAIVNETGDVIDAKVIKGLGGGLNEVSLNAVISTRFKPGLQRGKPVKVRITIPIKFVLK
ncbi:MAG: energy transducer TonB [Ignavibacteriaceae bacterium]|nr:energy transducer TonB [Ignavibacteriaceae bacterium]